MAFNSQRQKAYLAPPCLPRTATNASQIEWVTATPPALKSRRNLKRLWSSHALWACLGKNKLGYLSDRRTDLKWWFCRGNTEYLFSTWFCWYKKHAAHQRNRTIAVSTFIWRVSGFILSLKADYTLSFHVSCEPTCSVPKHHSLLNVSDCRRGGGKERLMFPCWGAISPSAVKRRRLLNKLLREGRDAGER